MPIQRAAYKSVRKDKKRHSKNLRLLSELKTIEKKFASFIKAKDQAGAKGILKTLISRIDKAASKGVIHKNKASRKTSRLMKSLRNL